ncbi:hypothetical protein DFH07DRAFT_878887 [Mycena maculata]|uniref:NAD(P)-binding domain-containing protein n=1 Tax=Mycena maculata TaxID=230809 RepID=A0AAD7NSG0_9AGAR|nr:hypothetical protein DFH07DRAFT_878887 [Mycena maculata]
MSQFGDLGRRILSSISSHTLPMAPLNVLAFGGSRNIGYFAAVRLLEQGATVTFLLRSPSIFDEDTTIQKYVQSGHARLVKGDALNEADTRRAWDAAGIVDAVIFTIGTTPSSFSLTKGFLIKPHNLCTQCMLNVLCTMPTYADAPQPKFVALSSTGVTPASHKALPFKLKPVYSMIGVPHRDKVAMERVIAHCAGWAWDPKADGAPTIDLMGAGWTDRKGLPAPGSLENALVIHAGFLTDGPCEADEGKRYRVSEEELGPDGYKISRKDAAHFVVDVLTRRWNEFGDKRVNLTY